MLCIQERASSCILSIRRCTSEFRFFSFCVRAPCDRKYWVIRRGEKRFLLSLVIMCVYMYIRNRRTACLSVCCDACVYIYKAFFISGTWLARSECVWISSYLRKITERRRAQAHVSFPRLVRNIPSETDFSDQSLPEEHVARGAGFAFWTFFCCFCSAEGLTGMLLCYKYKWCFELL